MSLQEDALRDTRVLDSWLNDVDGVVIEVVINDAFSDSEVLVRVLNHWFLEVSIKAQNLSVIFEPLWSYSRNGVVLLFSTRWNSSELAGHTFSHGFK